jgi:DNA replication protein DnaC
VSTRPAGSPARNRECPFDVCDGSGLIDDPVAKRMTPCACRARLIAERRARDLRALVPKRYRDASWDRPPVTHIRPAIMAAARRYATNVERELAAGRGLWLEGGHGTGKTTLAMLVSQAAIDAGRTVAIYSVPRLLAKIRETFDDDNRDYLEFLDRLTEVDLLHIDDVGAERTNDWVIEQLYAIVNARYEEERSIVLTTNLGRDAMVDQIGARTVSRLEEMCEILPVGGTDLRRPRFDGDEPEAFDGDEATGTGASWQDVGGTTPRW